MSTLKYAVITFGLVAGLVSPAAALATNGNDSHNRDHQSGYGYNKDHKDSHKHKSHKHNDKDKYNKDHKNHSHKDNERCEEGGKGGSNPTPTPTPSTTPAPTVTPKPSVTPAPTTTPAPSTTPAPVGGNGAGQVLATNTTLPATGAAELGLEAAVALSLGAAGFVLVKRLGANA